MNHSSSLAIWLGLGAAFMGLLFTFIALAASKRKKAAATSPPQIFRGEADAAQASSNR